tara:strand:- start:249 stop:548 length:300 start_codon:yes stop_codon:yes gene_type:complete
LRDSFKTLKEKKVQVIGISMDKIEDQKKFKDKNNLPFPLLSDRDGKLVKAYGVKKFTPKISGRESFIIHNGKIAWLDRKASPKSHTSKVLEALKKIKED